MREHSIIVSVTKGPIKGEKAVFHVDPRQSLEWKQRHKPGPRLFLFMWTQDRAWNGNRGISQDLDSSRSSWAKEGSKLQEK
jgi:hypothetical protein